MGAIKSLCHYRQGNEDGCVKWGANIVFGQPGTHINQRSQRIQFLSTGESSLVLRPTGDTGSAHADTAQPKSQGRFEGSEVLDIDVQQTNELSALSTVGWSVNNQQHNFPLRL